MNMKGAQLLDQAAAPEELVKVLTEKLRIPHIMAVAVFSGDGSAVNPNRLELRIFHGPNRKGHPTSLEVRDPGNTNPLPGGERVNPRNDENLLLTQVDGTLAICFKINGVPVWI
jgi:hypothetical protein